MVEAVVVVCISSLDSLELKPNWDSQPSQEHVLAMGGWHVVWGRVRRLCLDPCLSHKGLKLGLFSALIITLAQRLSRIQATVVKRLRDKHWILWTNVLILSH
jgi:hypothetical protein